MGYLLVSLSVGHNKFKSVDIKLIFCLGPYIGLSRINIFKNARSLISQLKLAQALSMLESSSQTLETSPTSWIEFHLIERHSLLSFLLVFLGKVNPATFIRVEKMYALPVLLSSVACLVLTSTEQTIINSHNKNTLNMLLKLVDKIPG